MYSEQLNCYLITICRRLRWAELHLTGGSVWPGDRHVDARHAHADRQVRSRGRGLLPTPVSGAVRGPKVYRPRLHPLSLHVTVPRVAFLAPHPRAVPRATPPYCIHLLSFIFVVFQLFYNSNWHTEPWLTIITRDLTYFWVWIDPKAVEFLN